jgi:hypothetical protein
VRQRTALLTIFFALTLASLTAYSLVISIASVDPVAVKPAMEISLGKNNIPFYDQNEVRSASLSLTGATVTGATVQFYKRTPGLYSVRTTVTLLNANGNTISTGTACSSYAGTGIRTATITSFSPAASIDDVYRVGVAIERVASCV